MLPWHWSKWIIGWYLWLIEPPSHMYVLNYTMCMLLEDVTFTVWDPSYRPKNLNVIFDIFVFVQADLWQWFTQSLRQNMCPTGQRTLCSRAFYGKFCVAFFRVYVDWKQRSLCCSVVLFVWSQWFTGGSVSASTCVFVAKSTHKVLDTGMQVLSYACSSIECIHSGDCHNRCYHWSQWRQTKIIIVTQLWCERFHIG